MINDALLLAGSVLAAAPCESLKSLALPGTIITAAELVPAGPYTVPSPAGLAPPAGGGGRGPAPAAPPITLPARCRVAAVLKPSADSEIEMEAWLPSENWNGKFEAVGKGGWAGTISFAAMASALQEGYATASTDTGHKGGNAAFAIGHP